MREAGGPEARRDSSHLAGVWPLAGRSDVFAQVKDALLGADPRSVVLVGEVGVGKTRLGHEVQLFAEESGLATARVSGNLVSSGIPLGAFAQLLPAVDSGQQGIVDDRADLLRRCAEALRVKARAQRLVVFVDDAHLLDAVSATLVHQLATSSWADVIVTLRSGEVVPDAITALWKDSGAVHIELQGLAPEDVRSAVAAALGGAVDDATVATLSRRARGNMMFLRELVLGAVEEGALVNDGGVWMLSGELHPTSRLVELVEMRLVGLSESERAAMELVSFGEPVRIEELELLDKLAVAEELERKGLLRSSIDHRTISISLAHPLYGEVIRARTPAIRTRSIVTALADALEGVGVETPADLIRLARWRMLSGSATPDLMFRAAVVARWRFDFALAERFALAAVEAGAGFEAELLATQLASLMGRSGEATAALDDLAERAVDDYERGRVALCRLDNRIIYAGRVDEGLQMAEDTLASIAGTPLADEIAARRLALVLASEGPGRAIDLARPLLERTSGRALVWACMPAAYSLGRAGQIDEALEASRRGYRAQIELTDPMDWYPSMHRFYEAEALTHAGRFIEAEGLALSEYRSAVDTGSVEVQGLFSWQLAKSVTDRGQVDEGIRRSTAAVSIYRQLDRPAFVQFSLIYRAMALAVGRRVNEAQATMDMHDSLALDSNFFMGVDLAHARAWLAIATGNIGQAAEMLTEGAATGLRIGDLVGASTCLHTAARIGRAAEVADQLKDITSQMQGALASARAQHVQALVSHQPDGLEAVADAFETMGATLLAAEAFTDAAVVWRQRGEQRHSAVAERRAGWLASQCRGAATPALQVAASRASLTAAEWEAVQLASAGRSNKEIAEELVISVRTVENRLQHAYSKLGVSKRSELETIMHTIQRPLG